MTAGPIIVVHGGAGDLPSDRDRRQYLRGVQEALHFGLDALGRGAAAAVCAAVVHMESHTIMNAGAGSALAEDGSVRMDAGFMDGVTRRFGAVTGVRRCPNPVLLAERLAREGEFGRFLGPPDVDELPGLLGLPSCEPDDLVTDRARRLRAARDRGVSEDSAQRWLDTVGAVALDADGHLAAAVSTGGMSMKRVGRVGDSPVVGAGFWAQDGKGACVTTGVGEALLRQGTARRCVQLLGSGRSPEQAAAEALDELLDYEGDRRGVSGLILLTPEGVPVLDHNSMEMASGWARPDGTMVAENGWRPR